LQVQHIVEKLLFEIQSLVDFRDSNRHDESG
jgi:hypothetical protein